MLRRYSACVLLSVLAGAAAGASEHPSAAPATLRQFTVPGRPGETCVILVDAKNTPLLRRCTYDRLSG